MNSTIPSSIADVYPRYSYRLLKAVLDDYEERTTAYLLRSGRSHYAIGEMFAHEPIDFRIAPDDVIISASLFFKGASYSKRHIRPATDTAGQIPLEELHAVPHPAFAQSKRETRSFFDNYVRPFLDAECGDYRRVVFLAADMRCLRATLAERGIQVVQMRHPSIAHNPGAMWRYLAFNFPCHAVYFADTDREFDLRRVHKLVGLLEKNSRAALSRPLQWTGNSGQMALILGNNFAIKPSHVNFSAEHSMLGYIILNLLTDDRPTVFSNENRHNRHGALQRSHEAGYEGPRPDERFPAKCFPYYGFDEQWLKEVVYYHFSDGRTVTQVQHRKNDDLLQTLDLLFQEEHGNELVWPDPPPVAHKGSA